MKIVASPTARLAVFEPTGQIVRHRYLLADGVFDARSKTFVTPYLEVPDNAVPFVADYIAQALNCGDAVLFTDATKAAPKAAPRSREV